MSNRLICGLARAESLLHVRLESFSETVRTMPGGLGLGRFGCRRIAEVDVGVGTVCDQLVRCVCVAIKARVSLNKLGVEAGPAFTSFAFQPHPLDMLYSPDISTRVANMSAHLTSLPGTQFKRH